MLLHWMYIALGIRYVVTFDIFHVTIIYVVTSDIFHVRNKLCRYIWIYFMLEINYICSYILEINYEH